MDTTQVDQAVTLRTSRRLSATQRAFLASQLRHPSTTSMNMALLVTFDESAGQTIDTDRLAFAFDQVVRASDVLRTFIDPAEPDRASISPEPTSTTEVATIDSNDVDSWARQVATRPFDLSQSCYVSAIARHENATGEPATSWCVNVHHLAIDATAFGLLVERTLAVYAGDEIETSRFYRWVDHIESTNDAQHTKRTAHWSSRVAAQRPGQVYLPSDRTDSSARRTPVPLTPDDYQHLAAALEDNYRLLNPELSWAGALVTATAVYLHRLTGASEFAIGMPVHHRNNADSADLVGPTLGVYPVDIQIEADDTFSSLHRRTARAIMQTLGNAHPAIVAPGDYDAVVNVIPNVAPQARDDMPMVVRWIHPGAIDTEHVVRIQATRYDRADTDSHNRDAIDIDIDLQDQVANAAQHERAPDHFLSVLRQMAAAPDESIYYLELLTLEERTTLDPVERGRDFDRAPALLAERLEARLASESAVVIEAEGESLSGKEFWQWIVATANELHDSTPAGARVGIALPASIEALVAIYACVISGRPFVPFDPNQPESRTADLAARASIVRSFSSPHQVRQFRADTAASDVELHARVNSEPTDEAYLLFTSGSTGVPKGVPITHLGLARYIEFALTSYFSGEQRAVAPLFTALTFDLTITTLFAPILSGGKLVVLPGTGPAALTAFAQRSDLTWCKATPSHLEVLVSLLADSASFPATVVVGGEAFRSDLAERMLRLDPDMAIFNEYGPTEAVVGCMIHGVDPATNAHHAAVPIGVPAPGVELRVVDAGGQRVPLGTAGELLISHDGMTAGYLDDGDASSPFVVIDDRRFYRSGDLVTRNDDLGLTYLGRIDEQIKVGGVRLDPAEVEKALMAHPAVSAAAVRQWMPNPGAPTEHCVRCGLPSNVPGVEYDADGVCSTCLAFDQVAPVAASWFRNEADLVAQLQQLNQNNTSDYDCLHLLSGGKDSTYALYRLVELGFKPYSLTLDNGFISEGALENCRVVAEDLGIDHEVVTTPQMNAIFRDSLITHSDVCHGCYKTIYTLATNRAVELDIAVIVTGLSRGQLFETRLIPAQFRQDRFDPDAIDRAVVEARKRYHRAPDLPNRVLDTTVFETDDIFESLQYLDIYRYLDVELSTVLTYLAEKTPWQRPADTGRSSNCLINIAGIHAHQIEQGYHNYAEPYAWDVRLGHKRRDESMAELNDPVDLAEIESLLQAVGYTPSPKQLLTGWFQTAPDAERAPTPAELRSFLIERLPAHAIPAAFVAVDELVTTTNGKLDQAALAAPEREHRAAIGAYLEPTSDLESAIVAKWEAVLGLSPISTNDDFFALGGDSLAAVSMIIELGEELNLVIREELAFTNSTPRELAIAIGSGDTSSAPPSARDAIAGRGELVAARASEQAPALSAGELSLLFHQASRPDDAMYNVGRTFTVSGSVDAQKLHAALDVAVSRHEPLTWTYGSPRRLLGPTEALAFDAVDRPAGRDDVLADLVGWQQQPFDLENGPLLRCAVRPLDDDTTMIALSLHHVAGDHQSLDQLWIDIDQAYQGTPRPALDVGYGDFCAWQRKSDEAHRSFWETQGPFPAEPDFGQTEEAADGYLTTNADLTPEQLNAATGRTAVANALAAAAAAVSPFFDSHRVEVDLVSSTRDHDLACELVGYLLNPLPVLLSVAPDDLVGELAARASAAIAPCLGHRAYPFASMVTDARSRGEQPPAGRVLVSYSDDPHAELDGMPVQQRMMFNGHAVADVSFFVEPRADHINLGVEYNGATVSAVTAQLILERFDHAFRAAVLDDESPVAELPAVETSVLRGADLADSRTIVERFIANVAGQPTAAAVEVGASSLTWAQLGARSAQIASMLSAAGVSAGDRVAVRLTRSVELPAAIMGVLLAGASYVPIDPSYPAERIRSSIALSHADIELTNATDSLATRSVRITADGIDDGPWNDETPLGDDTHLIGANDAEAYVIFTSGSTGQPNGVAISHRQLANSTNARTQFYDQAPSRFLMVSSVAFDSSIVGLFWSLTAGATLVLPADEIVHDIDALGAIASSSDLTHLLCVPTLYDALLDRNDPTGGWPAHVIVAGEACTPGLVQRHFAQAPATKLTNEYGPTEATVWATAHHCTLNDTVAVPIGTPVAGSWIAIIDEANQPQPLGVAGELVIGGPNVAGRYIDIDQSPRFVDASTIDGLPADLTGPIFRTGDRCQLVDGTVLFLSRLDGQLNVGGARVEPTEIEAALEAIPGVSQAIVVGADVRPIEQLLAESTSEQAGQAMQAAALSDDPQRSLRKHLQSIGRPDIRLTAHYSGPDELAPSDLRDAVAHLPMTHRPRLFAHQADLPTLPNGKVDRDAAKYLPLPQAQPSALPLGPGTSTNALRALFAEVLHLGDVDQIGVDQSFFDLGGDSLRALELLRLIEARLGVRLATSAIHNAPTPGELALLCDAAGARSATGDAGDLDNTIVMRIQPEGDRTPIFALHNLGVDGAMWRPMSGYLGQDHPLYGIADPYALLDPFGDSYELDHRPEIHETAARYVEHIQRIAPDGPIVLLGFCLGGVMGYEVAQQLTAAGREIENFIIVLDWHAPHLEYEENWITLTKLSYRRSEKSLVTHIVGVLTRRAFLKSARRRLEGYVLRAATRLNLPLNDRLRTRQYVEEGIHRIHSYVYEPYDGRITVIRSTEDPRIPTDLGNAGWGDLVGDLDVHYVPGVGERMLYEPNIEAVTEVVRRSL